VIFVDANIPMYLIGSDQVYRERARRALDEVASRGERFVTDVEVLQELLHRYRSIDEPRFIQRSFDAIVGIVDRVFAIEHADVDRAKDILLERWELSARDALHVAVMERHGVTEILSFDQDFDAVPGLRRHS
jgi:predicted nucleic acid-binding protein